jgi:hypothetical protein
MFSKSMIWALPIGAALAIAVASAAVAASSGQSYSQKFTVKRPGQASAMTFQAASQVQASSVTLTFPRGTKINASILTRCTTAPNCPASSSIGSGTATVSVAGATLPLPVAAYNRAGGMVLVVANPLGAPVVLQPSLSGRQLQVTLPALSAGGIPITVKALKLSVKKISSGHKAYITTPPRCPTSGAWTFTGHFTYPNVPPTTIKSRSACKKH